MIHMPIPVDGVDARNSTHISFADDSQRWPGPSASATSGDSPGLSVKEGSPRPGIPDGRESPTATDRWAMGRRRAQSVTTFVHSGHTEKGLQLAWDDIKHVSRIQAAFRGNVARARLKKAGFTLRMVTALVEERNTRPVVDWMLPKQESLAWDHVFLRRPSLTYRIPRESTTSIAETFIRKQRLTKEESQTLFLANRHHCRVADAPGEEDEIEENSDIIMRDGCWRQLYLAIFSSANRQYITAQLGTTKLRLERILWNSADAKLGPGGWPGRESRNTADMEGTIAQAYPMWATTGQDLGTIGGIGLRIYFYLLRLVAAMFFGAGIISLPAAFVNVNGGAYNTPGADEG
eukprot:COSAG05_NODE_1107_length_5864_cov_7.682741_7_plen_348_part_00